MALLSEGSLPFEPTNRTGKGTESAPNRARLDAGFVQRPAIAEKLPRLNSFT